MRNEVAQRDHVLERSRVSDRDAAAIEIRRCVRRHLHRDSPSRAVLIAAWYATCNVFIVHRHFRNEADEMKRMF
jgi:hypothetical protein